VCFIPVLIINFIYSRSKNVGRYSSRSIVYSTDKYVPVYVKINLVLMFYKLIDTDLQLYGQCCGSNIVLCNVQYLGILFSIPTVGGF
jgi:hypothetical protein